MELTSSFDAFVASLAGWAAFVALVVNLLKTVGVVKDGFAGTLALGLNTVGALLLWFGLGLGLVDVQAIDTAAGQAAAIGSVVLTALVGAFGSQQIHGFLKSLEIPVFGFSHPFPGFDAPEDADDEAG